MKDGEHLFDRTFLENQQRRLTVYAFLISV